MSASIPNVFGGFAPFPNTIATALLAYQSEAIGFGFGIKFQYAKRLIGAMTNEFFNGLDSSGIGNIIEEHNTELILRMKSEMPKWLDVQKSFIEASVAVEIAKANRTPSAFREIFESFSGAFGQQQLNDLSSYFGNDADKLNSISNTSSLLGMMTLLNTSFGGTPTDPTDPTEPPAGGEPTTTFKVDTTYDGWRLEQHADTSYHAHQDAMHPYVKSFTCQQARDEIINLSNQIQSLETTRTPVAQSGTGETSVNVQAYIEIRNKQIQIQIIRNEWGNFGCNI